jgi:ribonuclease-3
MCAPDEPVPQEPEQPVESQPAKSALSEVCPEPIANEGTEPNPDDAECAVGSPALRRNSEPDDASLAPVVEVVKSVPDRAQQLEELQKKMGVFFEDTFLLNLALTHPSYLGEGEERRIYSNQRLEFLGDAVLGLVVSHYLYEKHTRLTEGQLTKIKAVAVSEPVLVAAARELDLGPYILLGRGEVATGGRARPSILADAFEAVVGAVYLAKGLAESEKFILRHLGKYIEAIEQRRYAPDYKSLLQEYMQGRARGTPTYHLVTSSGPDHNKRFSVEVRIGSNVLGRGKGSSKKEAEQAAAAEALTLAQEEEKRALQIAAAQNADEENDLDAQPSEAAALDPAGEKPNP